MARYTSSKANPSGRAQRDQGGGRFGGGGGSCPSCSTAGKQSSGWCHKGEKLKSNPKLPQSLPERLGAEPWGRALSSWGG